MSNDLKTYSQSMHIITMRRQFLNTEQVRELEANGEAVNIATLASIGYEIDVVLDQRDTNKFVAYVLNDEWPHFVAVGSDIIAVERAAMQAATELMLEELRDEIESNSGEMADTELRKESM